MGDPVAGNPTQYMLEKAIAAGRLDWRFLTFEIPPLDFEGALRGARIFEFRGIMLAPPHSSAVLPYLEAVTEVSRLSEQVNCIKQSEGKLLGDNTQGRALRHLVEQATELPGALVTIFGAGRSARVVAAEMAISGVREICFVCSEPEEVSSFSQRLVGQTTLEHCHVLPLSHDTPTRIQDNCRLLVNALPLDQLQAEGKLPVEMTSIPRQTIVADIRYDPPHTWLLSGAKALDCTTIDGLTILIEQTALAFEIWTKATADRQAMREAVEEFLVL